MNTVWLTQYQLDTAIEAIGRINTHHDKVEIFVPNFDLEIIWEEPSAIPIYRSVHLLFQRKHATSSEFELITPVQICDEWLAKQMQKLS